MDTNQQSDHETTHKIDRLLDAIELVKSDNRADALPILRSLIQGDSNFEDAWLWMSLAVDEMDQSIICLDNVLRINPDNAQAATALFHLQQADAAAERTRARLRRNRDFSTIALWLLIICILIASIATMATVAD